MAALYLWRYFDFPLTTLPTNHPLLPLICMMNGESQRANAVVRYLSQQRLQSARWPVTRWEVESCLACRSH